MSYILNALREAEQSRNRERPANAPAITRGPVRSAQPAVPSWAVWLLLVVLGILVGGGAYRWYLGRQGLAHPLPPGQPPTAKIEQVVDNATPAPVDQAAVGQPLKTEPPSMAVKPLEQAETQVPAPEKDTKTPVQLRQRPLAVRDTYSQSVDPVEPKPRAQAEVPGPPRPVEPAAGSNTDLPLYEELTDLPELHLDMLVYSDRQAKRFVLINLRRYREGDRLAEGANLERIIPEGAQLSYQGQSFLLRSTP